MLIYQPGDSISCVSRLIGSGYLKAIIFPPFNLTLHFLLIPCARLKGTRNNTITFVGCMNIMKETTRPGIITNIWVWCARTTEGIKDIHYDAKAVYIAGKVFVECLNN